MVDAKVININQINRLTAGIMDIQVSRHPLACEITLVYQDVTYDIYRDSQTVEDSRVNKLAIVKTDVDASYVQQTFYDDYLWDDMNKRVPYQCIMTLTGLKRKPRANDKIVYRGNDYVISKVKPLNEKVDSVVNVLMYPDREEESPFNPNFRILAVFLYDKDMEPVDYLAGHIGECLVMDVVYDGNPRRYSFDGERWDDLVMNRIVFTVSSEEMTLYLTDGDDTTDFTFTQSS